MMATSHQIEDRTSDNRELATMPFDQALDAYTPNFVAALPPEISVEHFKRMVITAVNTNPDLRYADRRTLFNACVKCASDGLLPDGREAALTVYRTKIKDREGREHYIDAAQYLPMVAGIRKRLRNTGEVNSAVAEVVYKNDKFHYQLGVDATIEHEPAPLDSDPGTAIGAYAIISLTNGERILEVMRLAEIEAARAQSRAPNSIMWKSFWGEGARKTVLRRAAKSAPQASTASISKLLGRDDELPELPPVEEMPLIPPRPHREDFVKPESLHSFLNSFVIINEQGEEEEFAAAPDAVERVIAMLSESARTGTRAGLEVCFDNNDRLIADLKDAGKAHLAREIEAHYRALVDELRAAAQSAPQGAGGTDQPPGPPHVPPASHPASADEPPETGEEGAIVADRTSPSVADSIAEPSPSLSQSCVGAEPRGAVEPERGASKNLPPRTRGTDAAAVGARGDRREPVAAEENKPASNLAGQSVAEDAAYRKTAVAPEGVASSSSAAPTDIVGELNRKLTEAALRGQKALDQAWLRLSEQERDLARPMRAQYREIAAQVGP